MRTARNKLHIRALMQFNRARSPACLPLQLLKKKYEKEVWKPFIIGNRAGVVPLAVETF